LNFTRWDVRGGQCRLIAHPLDLCGLSPDLVTLRLVLLRSRRDRNHSLSWQQEGTI